MTDHEHAQDRPATGMTENGWHRVGLAGKAALALTSTFIALGLFTIGAALPTLQVDFAQTANAALLIQLIGSIAAPAFALASPLAGMAVARLGVRKVYALAAVAFVVIGAAPAASNSLLVILALRAMLGVAIAAAFTAGMVGIARLPERQRHAMLGLSAFLGGGLSIFVYPLVGVLAAESWRLAFLVGVVLLPVALLALALPGEPARTATADVAGHAQPQRSRLPLTLLVAAVVTGWTMVAASIYSPFFLTSLDIADPAAIGSILSGLAFGSLFGSGTYSVVQKRFGTRATMALGMALALAGCAILAGAGGAAMATAGLAVIGIGLGAAGTAVYALAIEAVGPGGNSGAAMGMTSLALYLPQIVFPLGAGAIAAIAGPSMVYAAMAAILALAIASLALGGRSGAAAVAM